MSENDVVLKGPKARWVGVKQDDLYKQLATFEIAHDWSLIDFVAHVYMTVDHVPPQLAVARADDCVARLAQDLFEHLTTQ